MQTQTPSFIFCKLRQLFSNNVFTFSFLLITTLYLSADWFMDRYFMPKNISFVVGIILWGGICIGNWKRKIRLSVDFLFLSFTVFMGYVFVCSLFTSQYIHSVYIVSGWILFVLMRNRKNPTETFNSILVVVGVLSALYGLLQSTGYIETQSYLPVLLIIPPDLLQASFSVILFFCARLLTEKEERSSLWRVFSSL